ncbi:hypothetical protein DFH06DRAFT_1399897 [Mycena polygramma]|nr:hypothetical protein DFH06DRAFT_1399897 [Mycena polygramma]
MPSLQNSLTSLADFRIGYSPQRPYPWRWTTPLALFILFASTGLLTCLNIPLSAYETVQESTYFPNATVPALPMSNMIPSFLHDDAATFAPQTLHVGDTSGLNNSQFSFTIYYNNPFACDLVNMTASVRRTDRGSYESALSPAVLQMTWSVLTIDQGGLPRVGDGRMTLLVENFSYDLHWLEDGTAEVATANLLKPPCSTEPARFIVLDGHIQNGTSSGSFDWAGHNITDLFAPPRWGEYPGFVDLSGLNPPFQNLVQGVYHLVRRDLGVILDNNIYSSPGMFNRSITPVMKNSLLGGSAANALRHATSNRTLMAQWRNSVLAFNETGRVPSYNI